VGANDALLRLLYAGVSREEDVLRPSRESFHAYVRNTRPTFKLNWFHRVLADTMQQFYLDVKAGKQPRLMIFAPPRHTKSDTASRCFPAWVFGQDPRINFIACSYSSSLAHRMNRDVQRIMDDPLYREIFPDTRLNTENVATLSGKPLRNSDIFEIVDHLGSYRSAGVGGGIMGQGFDIGLIDDPIADAEAANSEVIRQGIWEWYQTTFYTRQSEMAGIVLIMTRWNVDDLAGRLLQEMLIGGDQWNVVSFPAIAEQDEEFRKAGEALQPERFDVDRLRAIERTLGSYAYSSMYQQRPGPKGGTIFKRDYWQYWKVLPQLEETIISVDCAFKDLKTSDYVAIQVWARKGANKYLVRRTREQLGFSATVAAIKSTHALFPHCEAILIEDKANGPAVVETLHSILPGVIAINPEGGKVARAYAMQGEQEAGNIILPDASVDPNIEIFLGEVSSFPAVAHDDETDAMTQAINWFRNREGAYGMIEFARRQSELINAQRKRAA